MALAIGFLLFVLGAVTFVGWLPEILPFLKGMVSFSLLFWGALAMIVGYSQRKANREFAKAVNDGKQTAEADTAEADEAEVS